MTARTKSQLRPARRKKSPARPGHGARDGTAARHDRILDPPDDGRVPGGRRSAFTAYLEEAARVSGLLTPKQEREMATEIQRGLSAALVALKKALVAAEKYRDLAPSRSGKLAKAAQRAKDLLARFNPEKLEGAELLKHLEHGAREDLGLAMLKWHDPDAYRVAERFFCANLRLVIQQAKRFAFHGYMPLEDLVQEGNAGLVKAILRFDPSKGFRFSTYGTWWVRHALGRAMADKGRAIRIPVHMIELSQKVNRARRELIDRDGRLPTDDELAKAARIPKKKLALLQRALLEPFSLDEPIDDEDGRTFGDTAATEPADDPVWKSILPGKDLDLLHAAMSELPPAMRDVLLLRFGFIEKPPKEDGKEVDWTLQEIGGKYNLSRERIRQLQEAGLKRLRHSLRRYLAAT